MFFDTLRGGLKTARLLYHFPKGKCHFFHRHSEHRNGEKVNGIRKSRKSGSLLLRFFTNFPLYRNKFPLFG
ncbi:MAG: hypothetical protein DBY18_03320 [Clostridia bacterium]|nr:MAG: hypothetical protein DBY18_03320 [Clostridia bacterium]